jgi:hypothetical protein
VSSHKCGCGATFLRGSRVYVLSPSGVLERRIVTVRWIGANGRVDDCEARVAIGPQRVRVLEALERKGLVRYYPYGGPDRDGVWGLTQLGRRVASIEVAS